MLPGLPYHVHDPARPRPATVTPAARVGEAPSDATVLFDGSDPFGLDTHEAGVEGRERLRRSRSRTAAISKRRRRSATCSSTSSGRRPAQVRGDSQNRGNSGIFLHGRYEVQVLDSFDNLTYPDGQAGRALRAVAAPGERGAEAWRVAVLRHRLRGAPRSKARAWSSRRS
jgi:hypothetical protein